MALKTAAHLNAITQNKVYTHLYKVFAKEKW